MQLRTNEEMCGQGMGKGLGASTLPTRRHPPSTLMCPPGRTVPKPRCSGYYEA